MVIPPAKRLKKKRDSLVISIGQLDVLKLFYDKSLSHFRTGVTWKYVEAFFEKELVVLEKFLASL